MANSPSASDDFSEADIWESESGLVEPVGVGTSEQVLRLVPPRVQGSLGAQSLSSLSQAFKAAQHAERSDGPFQAVTPPGPHQFGILRSSSNVSFSSSAPSPFLAESEEQDDELFEGRKRRAETPYTPAVAIDISEIASWPSERDNSPSALVGEEQQHQQQQGQRKKQYRLEEPDSEEKPESDVFIPPHVYSMSCLLSNEVGLAGGKNPRDMGFRPGSVLEGVGRKLRGMDADRFRTTVMRQTGFLEPYGGRGLPK
jgi:hypothetical protein